ncbi:chromosome segregation protein SMC [Agaribacterium haliotis]|uniref:chromosome segregation protein SMC n=1 Tax=Agaribacterium haliotis TaxID=2013869 RepID=UPI000BB574DD|nr:chromosome segregation protein SMC [Agaribacterium haliotis]
MRLKTIKLAGFKSFVDPTSVNLPSNMCAVVGPNGCGKSNIIDAVRWVMGESSAKNLRGEAMTDVIFNGSNSRKPVGQASIELVFDNSDGTITGEYAGYAEISIKRRVTRDGQNLYYLNGNRCRRRDITDIFLGTGLGPRSYAIIEQGMISRLIEAKPEDLRVYIEEAAGISKYKERRKDTENRMRRTHENLERLTDIRDELERQLVRLERQAKAAEKYAVFKQDERSYNAKLQGLRYQKLKQQGDELRKRITESELAVEASVTQRVKFDSAIEKYRTDFSDKSDAFNQVQGKFYALGADIARIEQSIKHRQERERSLRVDLEQTERDLKDAQEHLNLDQAKIEGWQGELLEISPEIEMLEEDQELSHDALQSSEEAMHAWQQDWDNFNQRAAEPKQAAEVQQSRIQYLEQVQQRLLSRKDKIDAESADSDHGIDTEELKLQEEQLAEYEMDIEQCSEQSSELAERIAELRDKHAETAEQRNHSLSKLQSSKGRLASLEALQGAALGKEGDGAQSWLETNQLDADQRLAENLDVEAGWETALEVVLGNALQAVCSDSALDTLLANLPELDNSLDVSARIDAGDTQSGTLAAKVSSAYALPLELNNILCAEDLTEAKAKLAGLAPGQSLITKDGYWLSNNWLRVVRQSDAEAGVIARANEIKTLEQAIAKLEAHVAELAEQSSSQKEQLRSAESQAEEARRKQEQLRRDSNNLRDKLNLQKSKIEKALQAQQRAQQDLQEIKQQLELEAENLAEARALLEEAIAAIENDTEERESLLARRDELRNSLDSARQRARQAQDKRHELAMRQRSVQAQLDSMRSGIQRLNEQISRMDERREQLREALEEAANPEEENQLELEDMLERRISLEKKLSEARLELESTEQALRDAESQRDSAEKSVAEQRGKLESSRLDLQTLEVKAQNIAQLLEEQELNVDEVLETIEDDDSEEALEQELQAIANRIQRLGAINLAAIDEFKTESERKLYLDEQNDDLCEALETLEAAIRKIDKETRTRFKETYDQVNSGLQNLFPRLFGGGHAYLELTGEDLLDTGIAIMARPPGKKNSTIHLLSGGEKALTAIALVFSIFQLNPAPFCMLDEVDAPLDDANVGRYANIVEAMSEHVQFIYITHNKIAMEKAQHLLGVTMQEAGVSRMVTVDVEEAAELAAV